MLKVRYRRRNYCTAAPDWLPLIGDMREVCRRHDRRYAAGGSAKRRKAVDLEFRMELRFLVKKRRLPTTKWHRLRKAWGYLVAETYYRAVRIFGGRFWGRE